MGRPFQNIIVAPAVVALLLLSSMGGVLGWRTEMIIKEMPESSSSVIHAVPATVAEVKQIIMNSANEDLKKALLQAETLQCAGQGSYCNTFFGPYCCNAPFACVPQGIIGGVCVR